MFIFMITVLVRISFKAWRSFKFWYWRQTHLHLPEWWLEQKNILYATGGVPNQMCNIVHVHIWKIRQKYQNLMIFKMLVAQLSYKLRLNHGNIYWSNLTTWPLFSLISLWMSTIFTLLSLGLSVLSWSVEFSVDFLFLNIILLLLFTGPGLIMSELTRLLRETSIKSADTN